jgi:Secretion system C-terminal sorting domain
MKKNLLLAAAFAASSISQAADVRLVVQEMNHQSSSIPGHTYRVYVQLPSAQHSLQVVYGDAAHPLRIESSAPFFQSPYAGSSAAGVSSAALQADASVNYDSWITVGYSSNEGNNMWDLGVDFASFEQGGVIASNNGGWFLIPTDEKCSPDTQGLVLIGQFTSTGEIHGTLNIQGRDADGISWRKEGLTFSTRACDVFGCTDNKASNFNPMATFNDGSCAGGGFMPANEASAAAATGWDVFPNPLRSNLINIQLHSLEVKPGASLDIIDAKGSLVASFVVGKNATQNGNRITIDQALTGGTYQVVLRQGASRETKTIVVQ